MKTRVAVTYENGQVFQHFGHTEQFQIFTVEDGKILSEEIVSTNGSGHSLLADFLVVQGATVLICGGIGGGAKMALAQKNIAVFGGVTGETRKVVEDYLAGTLMAQKKVKNLKIDPAVVVVGTKSETPLYLSHVREENIVMTVDEFKKFLLKEKFEKDNDLDVEEITKLLQNLHD